MVDINVQRINNRALRTNHRLTFFQLFRWISVGSLLMAIVLSYAWIQHEVLTINYEIQDLLDENARLKEKNAALIGKVEMRTAPGRIDSEGRAMGLIPANQVLIIDAETGPDTRDLLAEARARNGLKVE